jgi:hypothetical protein
VKELAKLYLDMDSPFQAIRLFEACIEADRVDPLKTDFNDDFLLGNSIEFIEEDANEEIIGHVSLGVQMKQQIRVGYEGF